ncbi:MAG: FG-GAP repeat domain-containing protein [Acutalibacteraceae bacterium]
MKIRKRLTAVLILMLVCTLFSSCAPNSFDNSDLLRPPRATGNKAEIEAVIETTAGGDYTLKYPQRGDYRSAIIMKDLNGDGIDEAIALYKPSGDATTTHIMFIRNINGIWQSVGDFSGISNDIDSINIGDIDGDRTKEVLVSWKSAVASANQMTAYFVGNKKSSELPIDESFSECVVGDLTGDGKCSIMLLSIPVGEAPASAKLLQYNPEVRQIFTRSIIAINENITRFVCVQQGMTDNSTPAVFVDGAKNNNDLLTEVVYWDKEQSTLLNPLNTAKKENPTLRTGTTVCKDVNSSGIMNIPTVELMPMEAKENLTSDRVCSLTIWNSFNIKSKTLEPDLQTVISTTDGYYFSLPSAWEGNVTARQDTASRSVTFYEWLNVSGREKRGQVLLTIQVFTEKDWKARKDTDDFIEMINSSGLIYAVKVPESSMSELLLSMEEINKSLNLLI